ncbi:kinesin-like protein [Podospora pseudopauciseta]|uniref:Kinesin-like protein n=1 Tax=Podospora pseudopauciseta TaxID=2093780 RepID=A0ABR0HEC2_9PEZI|nr:kinesin-like protein [Podospora pseudopauciseta]
MPTGLSSSFASAAAGQTRDSRGNGRVDAGRTGGSGEWPRSNGTRTFRRPSTTPFNQNLSSNPADLMQSSVSDTPSSYPNSQPGFGEGAAKYTREELLDIFNSIEPAKMDVSSLLEPNWNPGHLNGSQPSARPWGKSGDSGHAPQDPSVCWDADGSVKPIGLEDMTEEERLMFSTDVNSTMKPPQPKQPQEGSTPQGGGINGRKTSVSASNYPLASPSTSRPVTRRRETADTNPFPSASVASPTASRFSRDEWFPRRNTAEVKEMTDEPEEDHNLREAPAKNQPFALRANTGGPTGFGSASSLWGPGTPTSSSGIGGGAFGNFAIPTPTTAEKRFPSSGGSRLAHLIPKDSTESAAPKASDAASWRPRQRTDTDPFTNRDDGASGSAALGGAQDNSPPLASAQPLRGNSVFDTPVKGSAGDFGMANLRLGDRVDGHGPNSPSDTNPFRSPTAVDGREEQQDDHHDRQHHDTLRNNQPGPAPDNHSGYSTLPRSFGATGPFDGSDRSQTSSVGAKGFPAVNHLGGWPSAPSVGTPDRDRSFNPFGPGIFGPITDLPSPGLGGLNSVFGVPTTSRLARGKLESLFPTAMQAPIHPHDQDGLADSIPDLRQANPLGAIGRGAIGLPREATSPVRGNRAAFEDMYSTPDQTRSPFSAPDQDQQGLTSTAPGQSFPTTGGPSFVSGQAGGDPGSVRTMVMPDRMRWVYLDPQQVVQGPFSGLEMNDWYKANFFTPDLRVKRLEDRDFEPLGQLIRRIGNSREPFLVPQMGIPHGPAPPTGGYGPGVSDPVPPLQNAFPSFGRTLTAAQQNDLERRKQEEQMYHARARELAQFSRHPLQTSVPSTLQHHSSIHSLQSQPSFGSMTSPITMPPQPPIGPMVPGAPFFDSGAGIAPGPAQPPIGPSADLFPADLNLSERQMLANMQATGSLPAVFPSQSGGANAADGGLQSQLPHVDQLQQDSEGFKDRLLQFQDLRSERDAEEAAATATAQACKVIDEVVKQEEPAPADSAPAPISAPVPAPAAPETLVAAPEPAVARKAAAPAQSELSLTEKVRKTQADNAKSAQKPSASGLPMPFPPPQNAPLPAPTAQRPASNLPSQYGDRSASGTPDTSSEGAPLAPPPTAPWAPQPGAEAHKGPSLKEIQEAEAKKAAKKEEAAAAARRAALEQETAALLAREKAAAAASIGLPATSTWGTGSPVSAASGSPWKQPTVVKTPVSASTPSKKTLADIQREEELRKQKAKEADRQASAAAGAALGKRYADLASKTSSPAGIAPAGPATQAMTGGGWSTVGAGGKVKVPTGPAAQNRSASTTGIKPSATPVAPKATPKPAQTSLKDARNLALDEFKNWVRRELTRGAIKEADGLTNTLLEMPLDQPDIISDVVYSCEYTLNGKDFAMEFVRRKKLADKGIIEKDSTVASMPSDAKMVSNNGWSEVAKKGSSSAQATKEEAALPGFRVVPSKKKGKK